MSPPPPPPSSNFPVLAALERRMPPPSSSSSAPGGAKGGGAAQQQQQQRGGQIAGTRDTFDMQESIDRRERAARVLGSWEMLAWYSGNDFEGKEVVMMGGGASRKRELSDPSLTFLSLGQSIAQTRRRFEKELIGLDPDEGADLVDEMASDAREEERMRRKGGGAGEGSASASGARKPGGKKGKSPGKSPGKGGVEDAGGGG